MKGLSKMRKRGIAYILGVSLLIIACGGCGTQPREKEAETVKTVVVDGICEEDRMQLSREALCNDSNRYVNPDDTEEDLGSEKENGSWEQDTLDGKTVDKIVVEPDCHMEYVTNEEIIYSKIVDGYTDCCMFPYEIWSVPIQKTKTEDKVQWEKRKRLLEIETYTGGFQYFYADEDYVIFILDMDFNVYDRQAKKFITPKGAADLTKPGPPNNDDEGIYCLAGNNIFLSTKYDGLYRYEIGSDSMEQIDAKQHGAYSFITYPEKNMVLYQRCGVGDECDGENHGDVTWFVYNYATGEKKVFITDEQWKKVYEDAGVLDRYYQRMEEEREEWNQEYGGTEDEWTEVTFTPTGEFYLYGHKIYSVNDGFVFSIDLEGDAVNPQYEEEFSECLRALDYPWYSPIKFSERKAHLELEEPIGEMDEEGDYSEWKITEGYYDLVEKKYVETGTHIEKE